MIVISNENNQFHKPVIIETVSYIGYAGHILDILCVQTSNCFLTLPYKQLAQISVGVPGLFTVDIVGPAIWPPTAGGALLP